MLTEYGTDPTNTNSVLSRLVFSNITQTTTELMLISVAIIKLLSVITKGLFVIPQASVLE